MFNVQLPSGRCFSPAFSFFKIRAEGFHWKRVMGILETHPRLINCTTPKARWTVLTQAAYVAHIF